MSETAPAGLFYDPFAPEGEQFFDPLASFQAMERRYVDGDVEHDYSADQFVADVSALVLDARFNEMFELAAMFEARMHEMCMGADGHGDAALSSSVRSNSVFGGHDENDGHGHGFRPAVKSGGGHSHGGGAKAKSKKKSGHERRVRKAWPGLAAKLIELAYSTKKH